MRKRTRGRPMTIATEGQKVTVSLRLTPEIKNRLAVAADRNYRSFSQEGELRLEESLKREDLLTEALSNAFDPRVAGLLLALGETIKSMGPLTKYSVLYDGKGSASLKVSTWDQEEQTRRNAFRAVIKLLEIIEQPERIDEVSEGSGDTRDNPLDKSYEAVFLALMSIRGEISPDVEGRWKRIRELMGPLASQLN